MRSHHRPGIMRFTNTVVCCCTLLLSCVHAESRDRPADSQVPRCAGPLKNAQLLIDAAKEDQAADYLARAELACAPPRSTLEKQRLAVAHLNLGVRIYAHDAPQALLHFRAAMDLDPGNPRAALNVGGALISLKKHSEAVPILEAAIARGADDNDTMFRLEYNAGFAFTNLCVADRNCDADRGERHFQRALELNPDFADTYFQLAAFMNDRHHDSRRAMQLFKQACDRGHHEGCLQYRHFKSHLDPSAAD